MGVLVFIYGTLKRTGSHHHLMDGAGFVADAVTEPRYRLFDCGWYPALVSEERGVSIEGELWRVPPEMLPALDKFEAVDSGEYVFTKVGIRTPDVGEDVFGYLYQRPVDGLRDCGERWS